MADLGESSAQHMPSLCCVLDRVLGRTPTEDEEELAPALSAMVRELHDMALLLKHMMVPASGFKPSHVKSVVSFMTTKSSHKLSLSGHHLAAGRRISCDELRSW